MNKHLIGIAFADLHIHRFRSYDVKGSRLVWSLTALAYIAKMAQAEQVPIFNAGDLIHADMEIENNTLTKFLTTYNQHIQKKNIDFVSISGNHDFCTKNTRDDPGESYQYGFSEAFSTFHNIDMGHYNGKGFRVFGVPFMDSEMDFVLALKEVKKDARKYDGTKILLVHQDFPGALTSEGIEIGDTQYLSNYPKLFEPFTWVLSGHIHRPQRLEGNLIMMGSPIHQTIGDMGIKMGYWEIYSNRKPRFRHLREFPKFREPDHKHFRNGLDYPVILTQENEEEIRVVVGEYDVSKGPKKLAKAWLNTKGIQDKEKRRALIKIITDVHGEY